VIAGSGFRVRECNESIMQCDRFRARKAVSVATQSGTWVKRLDERSNELRVFAKGAKLVAGIVVKELSAKLKCFRNRHFVAGRIPVARRLEVLCLGLCHESDRLECELPEPERLTL
jgi:hypothetical protein